MPREGAVRYIDSITGRQALDPDRIDHWFAAVLGENLMVGTMRLLGLMALIATVGGGSFWFLSR